MNELNCPACTAPGLILGDGGDIHCAYCGVSLQGQPLRCPSCGMHNAPAAEYCHNCGEPLSIAARVITRQGAVGPPFWLTQLRSRVDSLKAQEALASEMRMAQLLEIDRRRRLQDARELARQRATDRQIALVVAVAFGVLGVVVLVLVVLSGQGG